MERVMKPAFQSGALSAVAFLAAASPLCAAEVTYDRLLHPEPQNWLMNHHDFGSQIRQ
jgi:alcohol dehydrogenase (cytochrome c)